MVEDFLRESPLAEAVKVRADVVVHRRRMSAGELKGMEEKGITLDRRAEGNCELEANGTAVAFGKIIRKRDGYYFKVTRMDGE